MSTQGDTLPVHFMQPDRSHLVKADDIAEHARGLSSLHAAFHNV